MSAAPEIVAVWTGAVPASPSRRRLLKLILLIGFCFFVVDANAAPYKWKVLTAADAVQRVRAFEGNPELSVTVVREPPLNKEGPVPHLFFELSAGRYSYHVGRYTADAFMRRNTIYGNKAAYYGPDNALKARRKKIITQAQALRIARKYLQKHYPAPGVLNKLEAKAYPAKSDDGVDDLGFVESYDFMLSQDCGKGVIGPSSCHLRVDTTKREVVLYRATFFPLLISILPKLTSEQATEAAMKALFILEGRPGPVKRIGVTKPDYKGVEHLVYAVTFVGRGPDTGGETSPLTGMERPLQTRPARYTRYKEKYMALVDANSGRLLGWDTLL